jgi:hypothetical protein
VFEEPIVEHHNEDRGWTVNKEISIGDLVAIALAFASAITAYVALDRRITILETTQVQMITTDTRIEKESQSFRDEFKQDLKDIKTKLDILTERGFRRTP